jgi:hypothetical protein
MKVFDLEGLGQSYGLATTDLLRQVGVILGRYNGIRLEEIYDTGDNVNRYIYAIDGLDGVRFTLTARNLSTYRVLVAIYETENVHGNNPLRSTEVTLTYGGDNPCEVFGKLNLFVKNNKVYGLMLCDQTGAFSQPMIAFDDKYISSDAYIYDRDGASCYVYNLAAYSNNTPETAIKSKVIILKNGAYDGMSKVIHSINNDQFSRASYALIDINGTKYRCMIGGKLFVEDGEV